MEFAKHAILLQKGHFLIIFLKLYLKVFQEEGLGRIERGLLCGRFRVLFPARCGLCTQILRLDFFPFRVAFIWL